MTKPITLNKNVGEKIFDAARRLINQATINNVIVEINDGPLSMLVYPNDNFKGVLKGLRRMDLMKQIANVERELA